MLLTQASLPGKHEVRRTKAYGDGQEFIDMEPSKDLSGRKAQIVEVASRILASEGPRRFTAQRLASEIGVTPGAIYRHFESMDAIVDAVIDHMGALLFEDFPPVAPDPIERLELFFHRRAGVIFAHPHLSRLLLTDALSQAAGPERFARVEELKGRSRQFVVDSLRQASREGSLSKGIRPEVGAVIVLGAVLYLSRAHTPLSSASREVPLREVWSAIEGMLSNSRRSARKGRRRPGADRKRQKKEKSS
jgi:AcrR family transcriptional regulator